MAESLCSCVATLLGDPCPLLESLAVSDRYTNVVSGQVLDLDQSVSLKSLRDYMDQPRMQLGIGWNKIPWTSQRRGLDPSLVMCLLTQKSDAKLIEDYPVFGYLAFSLREIPKRATRNLLLHGSPRNETFSKYAFVFGEVRAEHTRKEAFCNERCNVKAGLGDARVQKVSCYSLV